MLFKSEACPRDISTTEDEDVEEDEVVDDESSGTKRYELFTWQGFGAILGMIIPPGDNQHSVEQIYSCQEGDNLLHMDILEQE